MKASALIIQLPTAAPASVPVAVLRGRYPKKVVPNVRLHNARSRRFWQQAEHNALDSLPKSNDEAALVAALDSLERRLSDDVYTNENILAGSKFRLERFLRNRNDLSLADLMNY